MMQTFKILHVVAMVITSASCYQISVPQRAVTLDAGVTRIRESRHAEASPRVPQIYAKQAEESPRPKQKINPYGVIAGFAVFGELLPVFLAALGRLGLIKPPPINTFTLIANNAMDAAVNDGSVYPLMATMYAQGIWKDLIGEYYSSGESTDFLTQAGGACVEHAAWCAGVTIP